MYEPQHYHNLTSGSSLPLDITLHPTEVRSKEDIKLFLGPLLPYLQLYSRRPLLNDGVVLLLGDGQVNRHLEVVKAVASPIAVHSMSARLNSVSVCYAR